MNRIGVMGGTFDPIHNGHIAIAEAAVKELGLDYVYMMPNNIQPFKQNRKITPNRERLDMLERVAEEIPEIRILTIEMENDTVSYTYDSMLKLKKMYPDKEIVFIMGADSLFSIDRWYKSEELIKICSFAAGFRPGYSNCLFENRINELRKKGVKIYLLKNIELPISSTELKNRLKDGSSIKGLVPDSVERYINEQGLYK